MQPMPRLKLWMVKYDIILFLFNLFTFFVQALSLDSDSFDVCTNLFSIMYFPDRAKGFQYVLILPIILIINVISEMFRVLKPEGMVILGTWHAIQTVDIGRAIAKFYNASHNTDLDRVLALADRSLITKVNFKFRFN